MSASTSVELSCDEPGCPETIPESEGFRSVSAIRRHARSAGWATKARRVDDDGDLRVELDFCADHRQNTNPGGRG